MKTKLLSILCLFGVVSTEAATLSVTNPGNSGTGTLRDQIAAASAGDQIVFATNDTIQLSSAITISVANLTINGFGGSEKVIKGANSHRLFNVNADSVVFQYVTLTKGRVYSGGSQAKGGAIYTTRKGIQANYCNFVSNRVHNTSGTSGGGAIAVVSNGTMTVNNSHFTGNTSQNCVGGGAIFLHQGGQITVTNSSFYGNIAQNNLTGSRGGAVCVWAGVGRFEHCTFSNNGVDNVSTESYAYGQGGALAAIQGGTLHLINNTVVNNYVNVHPDDANNGGAGIYVDHGSTSNLGDFLNNITGDNVHTTTSTGGTTLSDFTIGGGTETSQGYNLIENITGGGTLNTQATDILNQTPNLDTLTTHDGYHKYHPINCSSPAWNKGSSSITAFADQLGVNRNVHNAVDMGSIEYQGNLPESPEMTVTNIGGCYGDSTGSAIIVPGGKKITYLWSNQETGTGIENLFAGTYTLTTTNGEGCSVIDTFTITQPDSISVTGVVTHNSGGNSGAVDITATGGLGSNYTYLWMPGTITTEDISSLSGGDYTVTVSDSVGCEKSKSFTVDMLTSTTSLSSEFKVYPNPAHDVVTVSGAGNAQITLLDMQGNELLSSKLSTIDLSAVASGTYILRIIGSDQIVHFEKLLVK